MSAVLLVLPCDIGYDTDFEDFANGGISWYLPGKADLIVIFAEPIAMRNNDKISG